MNIFLAGLVVIGAAQAVVPDNVLYTHREDGSTVTISDAVAAECGPQNYRATRENSQGYSIYGCWIPDFHSDDVEIFLPNGEVFKIPKQEFKRADVLPCETDSQCEGLF